MSNMSSMTYVGVGSVLEEIGMVRPEKVRSVLEECANYAHEALDPYDTARALEDFGVAVSVHVGDIDNLEQDYASLLEDAAALTGGAVTVTDVTLHEGEEIGGSRDDVLEFARNGRRVRVSAEHFGDGYDYFDQVAACEAIAALCPDGDFDDDSGDDSRAFRYVDFVREENESYDSIMALTTPAQAKALANGLGLTIE
ncbi:hypothetical protein [Streptomyces sp. NPDC050355]|uniref:hypothetical protein n=1 Tax=Streptomyces sp. NPDC050355 TaxID=3365609 RepID=UPI0037A90CDE